MSALRFYELKVADVRPETADCVSVALEVPGDLKETFAFTPGQYLTFRIGLAGQEIRRSYSICTAPSDGELRVAIKAVKAGKFSTLANTMLKKGDMIEVMPPMGKFTPKHLGKHYLAFAKECLRQFQSLFHAAAEVPYLLVCGFFQLYDA